MKDQFAHEIKISGIMIGAAFLVFFGAFFWLKNDIAKRSADDADFNAQIASQSYAIGALASNKRDAASAAAYQKAIDTLIPPRNQIFSFPDWFKSQAQTWRVTTHFAFSGSETLPQSDRPGSVSFTFDAEGNPGDLTGFLNFLESQSVQYLISIDSLDEVSAAGGGDHYTVNAIGRLFFK